MLKALKHGSNEGGCQVRDHRTASRGSEKRSDGSWIEANQAIDGGPGPVRCRGAVACERRDECAVAGNRRLATLLRTPSRIASLSVMSTQLKCCLRRQALQRWPATMASVALAEPDRPSGPSSTRREAPALLGARAEGEDGLGFNH